MAKQKPQITKITRDFYTGKYRSVQFQLTQVEGHQEWYWKRGKDGGDDWYPTRALALKAVLSFIDEQYAGLIARLETEIAKHNVNGDYENDDEQNAIFDEITKLGAFDWESDDNAQEYFEKATAAEICEYALDRLNAHGEIPQKYAAYGTTI